jgi:riboflavin kinase
LDFARQALIELIRFIPQKKGSGILTSSEYARILNVSQQSASRYLNLLEKKGWIEREIKGKKQIVTLTEQGLCVLEDYNSLLSGLFSGSVHGIQGIVTSGLGEGAYYVKQYSERIEQLLGFKPYPGTLNIVIDHQPNLERYVKKHIPGFEDQDRSFGWLDLFRVEVKHSGKTEECYLIQPERTHRRNQIEFISRIDLRKKLSLNDGDTISIKFL